MADVVHNQTEHDAARAEPAAYAKQRKAEKGATGSSWSAATQRGLNSSPTLSINSPHARWLPSRLMHWRCLLCSSRRTASPWALVGLVAIWK